MGKISLVSAKYIIHAKIEVEGVVDRPDVIGSVFGQTEGLLGSELELRELQSSGRIGRIEVELESKAGKTKGKIKIPSSMDKTETALIAAAIETIQRIGPCNAEVKIEGLEDVRVVKRAQVISRAKSLLSNLTHGTLPDSKDIKHEVSDAVKVADIVTFGKEKLPAGPDVKTSEEIILVEGRADVLNLLKHDIKNAIALGGTSIPKTIIPLCKSKTVTVFVDGDRGGDLIIKGLSQVADVDFAAKAPDGKEVEEITGKEILQAIRSKISFKSALKGEFSTSRKTTREIKTIRNTRNKQEYNKDSRGPRREYNKDSRGPRRNYNKPSNTPRPIRIPPKQKEKFLKMIKELSGSKDAFILDGKLNILGKVPAKELENTLQDIGRLANSIVVDGSITKSLLEAAEKSRIKYLIGNKSYVKEVYSRVKTITNKELQ